MSDVTPDEVLDARGLMCPMPLVKARQALMKMEVGQILEIVATDKGSMKDFQGWARTAKNVALLSQTEKAENGTKLFYHYVQRTK